MKEINRFYHRHKHIVPRKWEKINEISESQFLNTYESVAIITIHNA